MSGADAVPDTRWERVEGVVDLDTLRARHVLVVGLGSGGSTVALELARAGVGSFTLVDPDRLEQRNVVRHECDDRYLGWKKAEAVADLIRLRNPAASVTVVAEDVFALGPRLERAIRAADLVAGCTDAEPPKHLLNRLCLGAGVPAMYGGVYAGGVGGEVVRCPGGPDDPCYACVTSVLKESTPVPDDDDLDYGVIDADGAKGVPGLGMDVRLVALLHAKLCLDVLLADGPSGDTDAITANALLFGTTAVEGLFPRPFASALVDVTRQRECLVCRAIPRTGRRSTRPPEG